VDRRPAAPRRGLVLVFTGNGKGKTTAALGLALRAVGHGFRVKVVQFVKGRRTGELAAALRLAPELEIVQAGRGFTVAGLSRRRVSREEHVAAAADGLRLAREALASGAYRVVVLDELLYALRDGLVTLEDVLGLVAGKPAEVHVVLTGRAAPPEVVAVADLVTEMCEVKHHYAAGVAAQRGIEF
jgi:cob(I)alamin adenosyltransferase